MDRPSLASQRVGNVGGDGEIPRLRKVVPHRDTVWLSGADGANLLLGIVIHVILTRVLLSDEYGMFVLLLDLFHVGVMCIDLGLPTLIARDGGRMASRLSELLVRVGKLQFIIFLGISLTILMVAGTVNPSWEKAAFLLFLAAGLQVFTYSYRAALRSLGEARLEAVVRVVDRMIVALLMVMWSESLTDLALATAIGPASSLFVAILLCRQRLAKSVEDETELDGAQSNLPETADMDSRELVRAGFPFLVAGAALVVNVRIEKLLLGVLATPEDVAVFQIAWLGFIAGYGPVLSLRAVLTSWFGEVRDDLDKLAHRYRQALLTCAILAPLGAAFGYFIGPFALGELFPDYSDMATGPFNLLLIAWLFHTWASPSLARIQVGDKPWNYTRILWVGICVSILFCLYLIPAHATLDGGVGGVAGSGGATGSSGAGAGIDGFADSGLADSGEFAGAGEVFGSGGAGAGIAGLADSGLADSGFAVASAAAAAAAFAALVVCLLSLLFARGTLAMRKQDA